MQYINDKYFSDLQKWVVQMKLDGKSYYSIGSYHGLNHDSIRTCLKRSSLSLYWDKGKHLGNLPILSDVDIDILKQRIVDHALDGEYIDVEDTIELAEILRKERIRQAKKFLFEIGCFSIHQEIEEYSQNKETGRHWVYQHLAELESELHTPRNVELNRIIACTPENMKYFCSQFFPLIENIPPCLRFCADETMLEPNTDRKVIIPNDMNAPIQPEKVSFKHVTAMCCCNVIGDKMPLFFVLPLLKKLPKELQSYDKNGQAYFVSSQSGWQTRDTFLWFIICFVNFLSFYRMKLSSEIRNRRAMLVLDGHKSRECPIGLQILKNNNIDAFILPAHSSHVTQVFDVGIGGPFKSYFSELFKKYMKNLDLMKNQSAQIRDFIIQSALCAWDVKANFKTCSKAAKETGTYPCSEEPLLNNTFVREITAQVQKIINERKEKDKKDKGRKDKQQTETININCKMITDYIILNAINNYINGSLKHQYLCLDNYSSNYIDLVPKICNKSVNDCIFLSRVPPFADNDMKIHCF